jgi:mono/diheme cytochrome c family protein
MMDRTIPATLFLGLLMALLGCDSSASVERQPESTAALRGREVARQLGCAGCHGAQGIQGVADPLAPGGRVPGWDLRTVEMYITCEDDIREWILDGQSRKDSDAGVPSAGQYLVPMPAYRDYLDEAGLNDLVAYFRAVSGWAPNIPDPAYEGRKIASSLGCFGCHGPSGIGGVASPGSQSGFVVPWDSEQFTRFAANDEEIRDWILWGQMPERLLGTPDGGALSHQVLQMPAYAEQVSEHETDMLLFYINWLRGMVTWEEEAVHVIG